MDIVSPRGAADRAALLKVAKEHFAREAQKAGAAGGPHQQSHGKAVEPDSPVVVVGPSAPQSSIRALRGRLRAGNSKRNMKGDDFHSSFKLGKRIGSTQVNITIWYGAATTTTAGVNYNAVFAIQPSLASEWADLINLYDEAIVDGGTYHFTWITSTPGAATAPGFDIIAFDPLEPAVLASVINGLQHEQHMLTACATAPGSPASPSNPLAFTPPGMYTFRWVTPKGHARASAANTRFGHEWSDTADAADTYGYLKPFWVSLGGAHVRVFQWLIGLHMRFRCRS